MRENKHYCILCNTERCYAERYDSHYCPHCNIWLENKCEDESCEYCKDRPEIPLEFKISYKLTEEIIGEEKGK
jgi:hypothetical protein